MEFLSHPAFWIVMAAISEVVGMSPLKDNSIVQLVLRAITGLKPIKKD